jgi:protein-serine/threonine kinase
MAYPQNRPLPTPPGGAVMRPYIGPSYIGTNTLESPRFSPYPYPPLAHQPHAYDSEDEPRNMLPVGTLIHKGFYDLLAMIPTPSSRFFWGAADPIEPVVAGPRYEDISARTNVVPDVPPPLAPNTPVKKGRKITKDMVSKPTGFVFVNLLRILNLFILTLSLCSHLVHASDFDQAVALLTRWGPEGLGKLGGSLPFFKR